MGHIKTNGNYINSCIDGYSRNGHAEMHSFECDHHMRHEGNHEMHNIKVPNNVNFQFVLALKKVHYAKI